MKNKKFASLGLAVTMVTNVVPAMATVTPVAGGHEAKEEHAGERPTDAEVCATQTVDDNESAACTVYAEVGSEFTVTIPKSLTLSGSTKQGAYDVAVEGDIAGDQYVSVVPDAQFPMIQTGKADVTATITQEITKFRGDNFTGTLGAGEAKFADGAEGAIDAQGLTAGAWNGTFNFNIKLEGGTGAGNSGNTDSGDEEPDSHVCNYENEEITKNATCKETGIKTLTCACGKSKTEEIPVDPDAHNYVDGTCTECSAEDPNYLEAGLYDANGVMLASWEESGIDIEKDYTYEDYKTLPTSGYFVLTNRYPATKKVVIPDGVTSIGKWSFAGITNSFELIIPDSVNEIKECAFYECAGLTGELIIPNSVTTIGKTVFSKCGLNSIKLSENYTMIDVSTFYGCTGLTSIEIPDSVTSIEQEAFRNCTNLTNVIIGNGVNKIVANIFSGCSNLNSVIFKDTTTWHVKDYAAATESTALDSSHLENAGTASYYLTNTYRAKVWVKMD